MIERIIIGSVLVKRHWRGQHGGGIYDRATAKMLPCTYILDVKRKLNVNLLLMLKKLKLRWVPFPYDVSFPYRNPRRMLYTFESEGLSFQGISINIEFMLEKEINIRYMCV